MMLNRSSHKETLPFFFATEYITGEERLLQITALVPYLTTRNNVLDYRY
jgi:hypothetical protein